ncbi:MAG: GDP-mannose 4,6-dehydratase [Acidimicrobiia bacterium]|nr:GDP-mannose 4,6-dehydratase [Acidimicrobiia bacterium]
MSEDGSQRSLVTGAHGFVGRHLTAHLDEMGDDVIAVDRSNGPDIRDLDALAECFVDARPEVVYHLAGQADVAASWREPRETYRANTEGTLNVLEAARRAEVTRVIATTSADVYGIVTPDELPLTEQSPLRPASPYAASKAAADMVCLQAHLGYGQDVIRVRAFNHLGPGQSDRFLAGAVARRIVEAVRRGDTSIPIGDLTPRRDFTDVRDVVRAYRLLATRGHAGEVYNVCSGIDVSGQELVDGLLALAGTPIELVLDPSLVRPVDLPVLRGDASRIRAHTGWEPVIPLAGTLEDLFADMQRRLDGAPEAP